MIVCQSCGERKRDRAFGNKGQAFPECWPCRQALKAIAQDGQPANPRKRWCVDCAKVEVDRSTKSGRCYDCAMKVVYARYAAQRAVKAADLKLDKAKAEGLQVAQIQRSPMFYRQQAMAAERPDEYMQVAEDEWWRKQYHCPDCQRWILVPGKCYSCAKGRERSVRCLPYGERLQRLERAS